MAMQGSSGLKMLLILAALVALVVIGFWVVQLIFSALFYLVAGLLVVGAGIFVYRVMRAGPH